MSVKYLISLSFFLFLSACNSNSDNSAGTLQCPADSHFQGADCVPNKLICEENGGVGVISWIPSSNTYSQCIVDACIGDTHLINNSCEVNKISCSIENGIGAMIWNGTTYSSCQAISCNSGLHVENGICISNYKNCETTSGSGFQQWISASTYGICIETSCKPSFHFENNHCESDIRSCPTSNGLGSQSWNNLTENYSACQIISCNINYHLENNECKSNSKTCEINGGSGLQSWNGSGYDECILNNCPVNFHIENNSCISNTKSCIITNGSGTQTWDQSTQNYGICTNLSCIDNFHVENNQCLSNIKNCSVNHGQGQQSWNGSQFGTCIAVSCLDSYHIENGQCLPNLKACAIDNGSGTQSWQGSQYSECTVFNCNGNFHNENNQCVSNARSCPISNGIGTQSWESQSWTPCALVSCNSGYHISGNGCDPNVKSCFVENGTGTQSWNGQEYLDCKIGTCNSNSYFNEQSCILMPLKHNNLFINSELHKVNNDYLFAGEDSTSSQIWKLENGEFTLTQSYNSAFTVYKSFLSLNNKLYYSMSSNFQNYNIYLFDNNENTPVTNYFPNHASQYSNLTSKDGQIFALRQEFSNGAMSNQFLKLNPNNFNDITIIRNDSYNAFDPQYNPQIRNLFNFGSNLLFTIYENINNISSIDSFFFSSLSIWKSDGQSTLKLTTLSDQTNSVRPFSLNGNNYYLVGYEPNRSTKNIVYLELGNVISSFSLPIGYTLSNNPETTIINNNLLLLGTAPGGFLYSFNGSSYTMIKDLGNISGYKALTKLNNNLFFILFTSAGMELWKTDGSSLGTVKIKTFTQIDSSFSPLYAANQNMLALKVKSEGRFKVILTNGSNAYIAYNNELLYIDINLKSTPSHIYLNLKNNNQSLLYQLD